MLENQHIVDTQVRMAEWSKAPDSSSGPLTRAWVQIPLLTKINYFIIFCFLFFKKKFITILENMVSENFIVFVKIPENHSFYK